MRINQPEWYIFGFPIVTFPTPLTLIKLEYLTEKYNQEQLIEESDE